MDRIVDKQINSLAEAYLQVCEQAKTTKDGARYTDLPGGGTRREFQTAVKGGMRVKWVIDKNGKGSWVPDQPEFKPNLQYVGATGGETKRIDPTKDDGGKPLSTSSNNNPPSSSRPNYTAADAKADQERAKIEAENKRRAARGEDPLPVSRGSQLKDPRPAVAPTAPQKSARQQELDAINADKTLTPMQKWAKANPKLAAAKAERDRTRGTSASTNPMLGGNKKVPELRSGMPSAKPTTAQSSSPNAGKPVTGTGSVQGSSLRQEIDAVRNRLQQVKTGTTQIPTGNNIKTKMNSDSSLKVTKTRTPAETANIRRSLDIQSADLFDIIQGEFIEEGYTQEDTLYMMANLNEEQLQEFMQYVQKAINIGKRIPGIKGVINRVGGMFNRAPKQMPAGQVGALRLYQDKANQSMQRLNQQTTRLNARDAQREANRLKNLNPTAVSDRNRREAAAQMRQRNRELGRPESAGVQPVDRLDYKPGDPMFDDFVKRHHADKRGGVVKFTDGARRIDK